MRVQCRVQTPLGDGGAVGGVAGERVRVAEWVVGADGGVDAGGVLHGQRYCGARKENELEENNLFYLKNLGFCMK